MSKLLLIFVILALNAKAIELEKDLLAILVNRIIKDINEVLTIKSSVLNNIDNNKAILKQLEKSILLIQTCNASSG